MRRGISVSELLMVLGLVAVVVLVAIPHMGSGRQSADEAGIALALVSYADAQEVFRLRNLSASVTSHGVPQTYCRDFALLGGHQAASTESGSLTLLPAIIADATPETPYLGHYFTNDPHVDDWSKRFGLYARPAHYGQPFTVMYYIGNSRAIWMKDPGPRMELLPLDNTWVVR